MRSALYEGRVVHRRHGTPARRFSYPTWMWLIDLDEVDELAERLGRLRLEGEVGRASHPRRWTSVRPGLFTLRREDFLAGRAGELGAAAREAFVELTGSAPRGVRLLTTLRSVGWSFNPFSLYLGDDGQGVSAALAEVSNTPWGESRLYPLGAPGVSEVDKALHVSPFLPFEGRYRIAYQEPAERLVVSVAYRDGDGRRRLDAQLSLARRPLEGAELSRLARRAPDVALRVSTRIYLQAAALALRGVPFVAHPERGREVSDVH